MSKKIKHEFKIHPLYYDVLFKNKLDQGRIITNNQEEYCKQHQGDLVIFNANIIIPSEGKIWYGYLNITHDFDKLKNAADEINQDLYILMEGDANFGYEDDPITELLSRARTVIRCNKNKNINHGNNNREPN
jgi:signal peptidase I